LAAHHPDRASVQATALSAALTALQPIVALLLDAGINTYEVTRFVRWASVNEAASRQSQSGKKPSISRIAAATGLSRAEVSQLLASTPPSSGGIDLTPRTSDKVIAAWLSDPDYLEPNGKPRQLPYSEGKHCFSDLVRRYAPDIPPRAMLNEMLASKFVYELSEGRYAPTPPGSHASLSQTDAITEFGAKISALGSTLRNNLAASGPGHKFETLVHVSNVQDSEKPKIARELARRCRTFSQSVERYLLDHAGGKSAPHSTLGNQTIGVLVAVVESNSPIKRDRT
jgi:Family of unknown function (DUF6502)